MQKTRAASLLRWFGGLGSNSATVRNILQVSMGDAASKVFTFATVFLLIRGLSVSDYASYVTYSGVAVVFSGMVGAGFNMALVRFSSAYLQQHRQKPVTLYLFGLCAELAMFTVLAAICLAFPQRVASVLLGHEGLVAPVQWGLLAGAGMVLVQFARTLYQAEERFRGYIGAIWLVQISTFVSVAALWLLHKMTFVPVAAVVGLTQLGFGLWLVGRYLGRLPRSALRDLPREQLALVRDFLAGSGWLLGYFLVLTLFSRLDVLFIMRFRGDNELAVYGVAFQYYTAALLFLGSIHAVLLPKFSRSAQLAGADELRFVKSWLKTSAWLIVPVVAFDLAGKPFFVWLNGAAYADSFPVLVVLSLGVLLSMMLSPLVNILVGRGEFRFLFRLSVLALLIDVAGNFLLIPPLGALGAAIVIVLTQNILFQVPMAFKILRRA